MTLRIASAEIVSILFMMIILGSLRNKSEIYKNEQKVFLMLTLSTTLGLFFDALSYILDAGTAGSISLIIVNTMAFSLIHVCIIVFTFYMIMIIRHTKKISFKMIYPVVIFSGLNILWIVIGICNGQFFSVQQHKLVYGPWRDILTAMPIVCFIYILFLLLISFKSLGRRNTLVLGSFVIFPLWAALILFVVPQLQLGYLTTALSCSVIFTYIRREEITEAHLREQIMNELSIKDTLTGLLNRRGFNEAVKSAAGHSGIGIVFCDLNALKYVNDNHGHEAGDAYIRRFADILRSVYQDAGSICRISGDEFVILLCDITKDRFLQLRDALNSAIEKNDRIASVGYAYDNDRPAMELLTDAEQEMYNNKDRYYVETGAKRRGR
ncbi:MAG: GGDEF domain-containing protein [Lachnospiraceae bacterium]|nr:GGDEF domain-containing protein [Lachnospiraceae bacterium]